MYTKVRPPEAGWYESVDNEKSAFEWEITGRSLNFSHEICEFQKCITKMLLDKLSVSRVL
jgi:hypothetical protein